MSEHVIAAVQKRKVDFATLAIGASEEVVLADRVDVMTWREITFFLSVYGHTLASGAGSISFFAYPQSWTAGDPGIVFVQSPVSFGPALVNASTPSPAFLSFSVPTTGVPCIAGIVRIVAVGARTSTGTLDATISVQLAVKDV